MEVTDVKNVGLAYSVLCKICTTTIYTNNSWIAKIAQQLLRDTDWQKETMLKKHVINYFKRDMKKVAKK